MCSDNAWMQHKSIANKNIKFSSLELIGPKVRISHSGGDGKRTALLALKTLTLSLNTSRKYDVQRTKFTWILPDVSHQLSSIFPSGKHLQICQNRLENVTDTLASIKLLPGKYHPHVSSLGNALMAPVTDQNENTFSMEKLNSLKY